MINDFMPDNLKHVLNDFELLHDDQYSYSVDLWCWGTNNPYGDCTIEIRAYRAFKSYRRAGQLDTIGIGKPFYCFTVSKRRSYWDQWPTTLAYDNPITSLESAIESAYDALLAYDPILERF